jgi:hypothetical protein
MAPMESAPEALTAEVEMTYDRRTARLHWATAVLVTVLWVIGRAAGYRRRTRAFGVMPQGRCTGLSMQDLQRQSC